MRIPGWLQELREVLSLSTHEERQQALDVWEARWVIDVHSSRLVRQEDIQRARVNILEQVGLQIERDLGRELARLMGTLSIEDREWGWPVKEVRGDAWVIRREPKVDA